jgi:hypothetical protein
MFLMHGIMFLVSVVGYAKPEIGLSERVRAKVSILKGFAGLEESSC